MGCGSAACTSCGCGVDAAFGASSCLPSFSTAEEKGPLHLVSALWRPYLQHVQQKQIEEEGHP
jgi:hypothetical protein